MKIYKIYVEKKNNDWVFITIVTSMNNAVAITNNLSQLELNTKIEQEIIGW